MALLKNPNLAVSASNVRVARYQVVEAKGAFDVRLHVEPSSSFSVAAAAQSLCRTGPRSFYPQPGPSIGADPGNIIQHQYTFQYGLGRPDGERHAVYGRHPAEPHVQ